MGITIHYETCFRGTKNQLIAKLAELAQVAAKLEFQETGPVYEVNFASDFDTRDQFTPMVKNEETGKFEIDESYRWAKIQAQPHVPFIDNRDTFAARMKTRERIEKIQARINESHGFVLSLWWGRGCEATNFPFVAYHGNGPSRRRVWKGSSFTKTQYAEPFVKAHITVCALLKHAEKLGLVENVYDEAEFYETGDITLLIDNGEANLRLIQAMTGMFQEAFGEDSVEGAGLEAGEKLKQFDLGEEEK